MSTHSRTLAWKIPWAEEPGRLQSMGSLRVRHDLATSLSLFTFMHWRRTWQPTPVFLPGESQGRGNPVGYRLWGRTESDTTEVTQQLAVCCILSAKAAPAHFDAKEKQIPHLLGVCVLYLMEIQHLDLLPQGESLIDIHSCCTVNQHDTHTKVTPPLSSGSQPSTE